MKIRTQYRSGGKPLCLAFFGLILSFFHAVNAAVPSATRPNIVLILADDLGYSDLGCYGSEIATPHLDKLARNGMQFTQFYTTPRCCPTRASLLTGLYPQQAGIGAMMEDRGVPGYRGELNNRCITIAEELRMADYHALMVGKWHVSHIHFNGKRQLNYESDEPFWENKNGWPLQRGFEEFFGTIHGVCSYYDPFSLVQNNTPIRAGKSGFYYTDVLSERASSFIDRYAGGDKPFFLYVSYTAPHWPLQAPESDIAKYRKTYATGWDAIRANRHRRQIELGLVDATWPLSPRDPNVEPWEKRPNKEWEANRMATYAAMVDRMDRGIGRIMAKLKEKGADENTLVVFFSDNGACAEVIHPDWYDVPSKTRDGRKVKVGNDFSALAGPEDVWQSYGLPWANVSDTPLRLYKHFTHEGGISTPFIAHWPGVIKTNSGLNKQLAHITDLLPTFVEVSGGSHPTTYKGQEIQPLEGRSMLPLFQGLTRTNNTPVFWEHEGNRAVRSGKWKLVSQHPNAWELYDIDSDRTEQHNLAGEYPDRVKEMSAQYQQWAARCNVLEPGDLPRSRPIKAAASND